MINQKAQVIFDDNSIIEFNHIEKREFNLYYEFDDKGSSGLIPLNEIKQIRYL